MRPITLCAVCFALAGTAVAQTTWIVDAGGSGNFQDIPPALAAAAPGDTLLVRPGTYTPGTTSIGVHLVGGPGVVLNSGRFTVQGLPAGQTFAMTGFQAPTYGSIELGLSNDQGRVVFQDLRSDVGGVATLVSPDNAVLIANCAHVSFNRCFLAGGPAIVASASTVLFTSCGLFGRNATSFNMLTVAQPAIRMFGSTIRLAETYAIGAGGSYITLYSFVAPVSAIEMTGGSLRIAGTTATIQGGTSAYGYGVQGSAPAIHSTGGLVEIDPHVALGPRSPGTNLSGTSTFVTKDIPSLTVDHVVPGSMAAPTLLAPPGYAAILFASAPGDPRFALFDELWLDLPTSLLLAGSVIPLTGSWTYPHPVSAQVLLERHCAHVSVPDAEPERRARFLDAGRAGAGVASAPGRPSPPGSTRRETRRACRARPRGGRSV